MCRVGIVCAAWYSDSTFTPGISETKGAAGGGYASVFYLADASGNSRGLLNGSNTNTDGYNWDAFGNLVSRFGSNPTMFAWNEASGYQSDSDDGLTLLGYRYYDKRTGRFISQDPAGAGGNWYGYAGNDPMNGTDPSGLSTGVPGSLGAPDQHYSGAFGSDPFELFGGQSNAGNFQTQTGQGAAQQTQGPATPSTDLIFVGQGMIHPAPIIIEDGPFDWLQQYGGLSTSYKEVKMWLNANKFRSQGGARIGIAANVYAISNGISYIGNPAPAGFLPNASAGVGGAFSVVLGMGTASAGADMAIGGTTAAAFYGGLASATGIGAIIVGGTVVGVAGYRASDAWVNTTSSGAWFTGELGAGVYAVGKLFGNYNFILPFDFWKKVEVQTPKSQHMKHDLPVHHLLPHCR